MLRLIDCEDYFFRKSARALLHGTFQTQTMHVQYIFSSSNEKKCFAHGLNFRRVIRFVPPYPLFALLDRRELSAEV